MPFQYTYEVTVVGTVTVVLGGTWRYDEQKAVAALCWFTAVTYVTSEEVSFLSDSHMKVRASRSKAVHCNKATLETYSETYSCADYRYICPSLVVLENRRWRSCSQRSQH